MYISLSVQTLKVFNTRDLVTIIDKTFFFITEDPVFFKPYTMNDVSET